MTDARSPVPGAATLSRRGLLKRALGMGVVGAGGATLATLLAACGGSAPSPAVSTTTASTTTSTTTTASGSGAATPAAVASPATSNATTTTAPTAASVHRGGTLTWAYTTTPLNLDPVWTQALTDGTVLANIVQPLIRTNEKADLVPGLATAWDASSDGLTYTFHLRPNVTFHNGKAMVADDVLASLARARAMGIYTWTQANVTSVDKVDDATVTVTLSAKVASFLARMAVLSNAIFPADEVTAIGKNQFTKPIGTGPFMLKEWVRNDHVTLAAFPGYWDLASDGKPYPYLDQVIVKQVAEDNTKVLQVQGGQLTGADSIPYSLYTSLQKDPRGQLVTFPQQQIQFFEIHVSTPPFDDVKVRQAMSLALDRQVFVDRATAGTAVVGNSFFPKTGQFWDPDLTLPYDPAQAKQLIAASKYPNGYSGVKIQIPSGNQLGRDNAQLAQNMWQQVGLTMTIEEIDGSVLSANRLKGQFEVISGFQWTNGTADPDQQVEFYIVTPRFLSGYQPSQHMLDLVQQASQELDPAKRQQLYYEIQSIYNQDVGGTITLYYTQSVNYLGPKVRGFVRSPLGVPLWWQTWLAA